MPDLNPPQNGAKSSRFASLNVFKLKSGSGSGPLDTAPPLPPKDLPRPSLNPPSAPFYSKSFFSRSAASLVPSLSPDSFSGPATPSTPYPPMPSTGYEFGKRSNIALASANGRVATASPAPSASGTSLKSSHGADYLASPSMDGSTDSSGSSPNASPNPNTTLGIYMMNSANSSSYTMSQVSTAGTKPKKGIFKLANLARRNRSKKDLSDTLSTSGSVSKSASVVSEHEDASQNVEGDEGISTPWNFQHHIHVDEGYIGLPPSWSAALSQFGFDEDEIAVIHARRRAAATALVSGAKQVNPNPTYSLERPASPRASTVTPPSISTSSSATLLEPVPRSSSLRKGYETLKIHPPSICSVATSTGGGSSTIGGPSPAASPGALSFSMKSFVSGIKDSLASDSASTKGSRWVDGEEPDQYVFVDGGEPKEGRIRDQTLIEPHPFDASSVSSYHTHTLGTQQRTSQEQQTPRTGAFPQIQVQRAHSESGHVSSPSAAVRAPSPLTHSTSLPVPTPPRDRSPFNHSNSSSLSHSITSGGPRSAPLSAPPQTLPRRLYHVVNTSSDSYDGENYPEPPPAYGSPPKEEWVPKNEKEGPGVSGGPPPPNRPIPAPPAGELPEKPSAANNRDTEGEDQGVSMPESSPDTTRSTNGIPGTVDKVKDISSSYNDGSVHRADAEMDQTGQADVLSPTPSLVIDKRVTKLTTLPPRISLHQDDLEDWSESLFSAIGSNGKRSSVLIGDATSAKEKRTSIWPISPLSTIGESGSVVAMALNALSQDTVAPNPSDVSFEVNLTLGPPAKGEMSAVEEGVEEQAEEGRAEEGGDGPDDDAGRHPPGFGAGGDVNEVDAPPTIPPTLPPLDVSFDPSDSPLGKDVDPPEPISPSSAKSPSRASVDNIPPTPPPKPKPKPTPFPLSAPPAVTLVPPRTNIIPGISGRSPVNSLFGTRPQPLPVPIPPSQIRAQLRPAPPKPLHPPPTLPLPPLKRAPSQPNLQPPPSPQPPLLLPPVPSPEKALMHDTTVSQTSSSDSRPNSSQTLQPVRTNQGGRDSDLSIITVTPATIATAKAEVVRRAIASVIDPDTISLASGRESLVSAADTDSQTLPRDKPDPNEQPQSPRTRETPDDSMTPETSSVSLLRDGSQSKWPAPPPPPVEIEPETPRLVSRFRTTSLGRVSQLQAMGGTVPSPRSSHFSNGSSDTTSSSTSESMLVATPKGVNGLCSPPVRKTKSGLAAQARMLNSTTGTFGGVDVESDSEEESEPRSHPSGKQVPESNASASPSTHPLLAQLRPYISSRDPVSCFADLVEIAEGESGSVFAAQVVSSFVKRRRESTERPIPPSASHVAIKRIPLPPPLSLSLSEESPVSNKLFSLLHELSLLKGLDHGHLLLLDGVYVGSNSDRDDDEFAGGVDTSLWIRMELMERSLADVIGLVAEGLALQERLVGRFASDILHGLDYLQRQHIAHRDVRSDNLLVNAAGVVKLADFSNATRVDRNAPTVDGAVGVIYWQAPEMRAGPYNALKVDIWSLGATVWELAETVPPFSMPASPSTEASFAIQAARHEGSQWPPLTHPEHYSRAFHEFLRLCGKESAARPGPGELLNTPFISNACGRAVILQLLSQCRSIEEAMVAKETSGGRS